MRTKLLLILLFSSILANSQTFRLIKKQKQPVSVLHHKFDSIKSNRNVEMTIPKDRTCLTPEINSDLQIKYGLPSIEEYETEFAKQKNNNLLKLKSGTIITIPVIVHVIHSGEAIGSGSNISSAQVISQIEVLNEDFRRKSGTNGYNPHPDGADVEIEFALALRDEYGNFLAEPGIHRVNGNKTYWEKDDIQNILKPQTIWESTKYMNIWTANFGGDMDKILGYAQFPSLSNLGGLEDNEGLSTTDGVVIGYKVFGRVGSVSEPYDGGRTTTHEVGHWLGLRHIWGDGNCLVDDYCDDTPRAGHPNYECTSINSCLLYSGQDMIENYMDYTPDACMNIFTQDQKNRMQTVMQICPRRKELLNSNVHLTLEKPIAYFSSDMSEICAGESVTFTDESINTPTGWNWTFYNSSNIEVGTFTSENPTLTFNNIGVYSLRLIVLNSFGADTLYKPNCISVLSAEFLSFPFNENFEYLNALDKWVYYNPDGDRTWKETSNASSGTGTWSVFIDNYSNIDGDPSGKLDALFSPKIDLSIYQDAYLTFDVAYAKYSGDYSDTLAIYVSNDCGSSFNLIWYKGGDELATAPNNPNNFIPISSEWRTERISLKNFNGISNLHIAFVNWSGWGNNLYIDSINILVPSYTTPSFTLFNTPNDTVSVGTTIAFSDYSIYYPTTWSWVFESGTPATSNIQNPYVTYNSIGSFDVELTTSNTSGGDNWLRSNYITVVDKPIINITSDRPDNTICKGDSIILSASGGYNYEWFDERGYLISNSESLKVYPQETTTYKVIGFDSYGGTNSITESVIVNNLPDFSLGNDTIITLNDSVLLDVGDNYNSYLWSDFSLEKTLLIKGSDYGIGIFDIWVEVTNINGCQAIDSISISIEESTGIIDIPELAFSIKVYPIPTNDYLNVIFSNIKGIVFCEIYDLQGKKIKYFELSNEIEFLNINDLIAGYYSLRFHSKNFDKSIKIIKIK